LRFSTEKLKKCETAQICSSSDRPQQRRMRNRILVFSASARDQLQQYAEITAKRLLSLRINAHGADSSVFSFLRSHFSTRGRQLRFRIHRLLESVSYGNSESRKTSSLHNRSWVR
jgi:hypothetical protein